ncbi:maltase A2-like [Argiope bruennichi]|uniref:alpha-glucosidase n=1 Tax=Argiope bruennichi TaxID=94029 RepID=A0A8T0G0U4_ARGBR|nr:maltase A2-like [Argiope bruennichi]KAF8796068.1 Neutral and basic amino acid transport like protein [Argiope bruennichi]
MTALNNIVHDASYHKIKPEVLIELPDPKPISDNCTIIMNGHHNYGMSEEKESCVREEIEEEVQPFLNHCSPNHKLHSMKNSNSAASSNSFPLKESFAASSAEEDSDAGVEPESSTHLLQDQEQMDQSPKCLRNKAKLPTFKSSPSKKQASHDPHSHIQHRPLGISQDTTPDHYFHIKRYWPPSTLGCMLLSVSFFILIVTGLVVGFYFLFSNNCDTRKQWWQSAVIYEIFPASFQDTDGDGFGDMKGLIERLDYIQNLSVDIVRLNSIFSALDYPLEYEHVIDFANIDPHLGRIEDFQEMVQELHERGMHVILDMNPTVTSDQHTWAAHWLLHIPGPFQHFYINVTEEEGEEPPLEANPDYNGRTWTPPHRTFGNHLFLNWSNPLLQLEMRSVLELWLSQGIDGFYMKHLENIHVANSDHIIKILHQWRQLLDKYSVNSTRKLLMVSHDSFKYLQSVMDPLTFLAVPSMFDVVDASLNLKSNGSDLIGKEVDDIRKFWSQFAFTPPIVWHMGSAETMRLNNRIGGDTNMAALFLLTILPGSFSTFYGDEIGLQDSVDLITSEVYRGGQLAPMQWTPDSQANFTSEGSTPWLPIHPNYMTRNVDCKEDQLQLFRKLAELKKSEEAMLTNYGARETSLMHTLAVRFSTPFENEGFVYEWYQNPCGLVGARTVLGDVFLLANFGTEFLGFNDDTSCQIGSSITSFITTEYMTKQIEVILATNNLQKDSEVLRDLLLEPGEAIIGRFIT